MTPEQKQHVSGTEVSEYFLEKYKQLGGMTPQISKEIGW